MNRLAPLATLLALLLALSACGAAPQEEAPPAGDSSPAEEAVTLEDLYGADYQAYITETIEMQMGNRMDKTPEVTYFPITDKASLTDYVAIDETTAFYVDKDGNIVLKKGQPVMACNKKECEQIPLLYPGGIAAFYEKEVKPYDAEAEFGEPIIGYELSFTKYFYKPVQLRTLDAIMENIRSIERDTDGLLDEIMK